MAQHKIELNSFRLFGPKSVVNVLTLWDPEFVIMQVPVSDTEILCWLRQHASHGLVKPPPGQGLGGPAAAPNTV